MARRTAELEVWEAAHAHHLERGVPARHRQHIGHRDGLSVAEVEHEQRVRRRRLGEGREAGTAERRARGVEPAQRPSRGGEGACGPVAEVGAARVEAVQRGREFRHGGRQPGVGEPPTAAHVERLHLRRWRGERGAGAGGSRAGAGVGGRECRRFGGGRCGAGGGGARRHARRARRGRSPAGRRSRRGRGSGARAGSAAAAAAAAAPLRAPR